MQYHPSPSTSNEPPNNTTEVVEDNFVSVKFDDERPEIEEAFLKKKQRRMRPAASSISANPFVSNNHQVETGTNTNNTNNDNDNNNRVAAAAEQERDALLFGPTTTTTTDNTNDNNNNHDHYDIPEITVSFL